VAAAAAAQVQPQMVEMVKVHFIQQNSPPLLVDIVLTVAMVAEVVSISQAQQPMVSLLHKPEHFRAAVVAVHMTMVPLMKLMVEMVFVT
jgi:hypothetical protein